MLISRLYYPSTRAKVFYSGHSYAPIMNAGTSKDAGAAPKPADADRRTVSGNLSRLQAADILTQELHQELLAAVWYTCSKIVGKSICEGI